MTETLKLADFDGIETMMNDAAISFDDWYIRTIRPEILRAPCERAKWLDAYWDKKEKEGE